MVKKDVEREQDRSFHTEFGQAVFALQFAIFLLENLQLLEVLDEAELREEIPHFSFNHYILEHWKLLCRSPVEVSE